MIPLEIECTSYAIELLSDGDLCTHVVGALVTPISIQMLYYDCSIVMKSEPLFFTTATIPFITMLSRIVFLTCAKWGYSVALKEAPTPFVGLSDGISDQNFVGKTLKLTNGWMLGLGATVFGAHRLIGHGTCVTYTQFVKDCVGPGKTHLDMPRLSYTETYAILGKLSVGLHGQNVGKPVIVKWSWSLQTRTREATIIEAATTRVTEAGDTWVLDHLPIILHSQEVADTDSLHSEELKPIEDLKTAPELTEVIRGIFKCYRWLYETAKIMHWDISLGNLMYHIKNDSFDIRTAGGYKTVHGDRSSCSPTTSPPISPRSRIIIILWIITSYHNRKRIDKPPLWEWKHLGMQHLQEEKNFFLLTEPPPHTENFTLVAEKWIHPMLRMFIKGISERRTHDPEVDPPFVDATLRGHVTFVKFAEIMDQEL
ncbi:hypothetical protein B0H19DRAFT_1256492 [Mycena capillaripes]|nr:hypothetical protein B0H19DRAFT_1256492 [Mycena capillaripes]